MKKKNYLNFLDETSAKNYLENENPFEVFFVKKEKLEEMRGSKQKILNLYRVNYDVKINGEIYFVFKKII